MPGASARLRKLLALDPIVEQGSWVTTLDALSMGEKLIPEGHAINQPEHLFSRIEDEWIQSQIAKLHEMSAAAATATAEAVEAAPVVEKPAVSYDDFAKLDIRTAKILAAESVPKADKLLKLTLDVNGVQRTVVSGIAKHYKPEDLPGKHVVILANLEPRKIRGVESQGMILMAESGDGRLHFVQAATDESGLAIS
jgi:methionyl-tRNA synthetase